MRVALVCPSNAPAPADLTGRWPPLGLAYLAGALEARDHEVSIIDADALGLDVAATVARCVAAHPDVVGISIFSPYLQATHLLVPELKRALRHATLVGGGPHATLMPERTLREFEGLDYLLLGEAEESLPTLLDHIESATPPDGVPGLVCRRDGQVEVPESLPPPPAPPPERASRPWLRDDRSRSAYFSLLLGSLDSVITGRGCPWRCSFCCQMYRSWRPRPAEAVVEEISQLYHAGIRAIDIQDDTFTAERTRVLEILESLSQAGFSLRLRVRARVDTVDRELLQAMRGAGVRVVSFGLESGSQRVLDQMGKRIDLEQSRWACRLAKEEKLLVTTSWVIGFPGETPDTVAETLAFIGSVKPDMATFHKLQVLPGTQVYQDAKGAGVLRGDWTVHDRPPWIQLPWMKTEEDLDDVVVAAQRSCYRKGLGRLLRAAARCARDYDARAWRAAARFAFRRRPRG